MSGREWKPGEVAMVTNGKFTDHDTQTVLAMRCAIDDEGLWFVMEDGGYWSDYDISRVRPLVVIDPEDPEQVARLSALIDNQPINVEDVEATQAALREFADPKPPKPAEPTGLGAVVEDADGKRWVQVGRRGDWYQAHGKWAQYTAISAVRVLSEGVTA